MLRNPPISALDGLAYRNRGRPLLAEGNLEAIGVGVKRSFEGVRAARPPATMVGDLLETPQVVGRFLEVRYAIPDASVPQRPDQGQEGGLAGAVVADKQGQRGEARGLPLPEVAKVLQRNGIQRHVRRLDGRCSVVITPYHSQCKRERPRHMLLTEAALLAVGASSRRRADTGTGRPGGRSPLVAANGLPGRRQEAAPEATGPSMDGAASGASGGKGCYIPACWVRASASTASPPARIHCAM